MTTANGASTGRRRALLRCLWLLPTTVLAQSNFYDINAERVALEFMRKFSQALREGQVDSEALLVLYKSSVDQSSISFTEFQRARRGIGEILGYAPTRGQGSNRQERRGMLFVITLRCTTNTGSWNVTLRLERRVQTEWRVVQILLDPD